MTNMPNTTGSAEHDAYPPQALHDYAFLADGERGALVGPRGEIAWLCAPRWHSGSVFSTLIGGRGLYAVTPAGRFVSGGHYEEGSLIWRSRWVTEDGIVESREALGFPGERGRLVLLRRVRATEGPARVRVLLHPRADYGTQSLSEARRGDDGVWTARVGDLHLRWSGGGDASLSEAGSMAGQFTLDLALAAGQQHDLVLELSVFALRDVPLPVPSTEWSRTERAWKDAVPGLDDTVAARDARQSLRCPAIESTGGDLREYRLGRCPRHPQPDVPLRSARALVGHFSSAEITSPRVHSVSTRPCDATVPDRQPSTSTTTT